MNLFSFAYVLWNQGIVSPVILITWIDKALWHITQIGCKARMSVL